MLASVTVDKHEHLLAVISDFLQGTEDCQFVLSTSSAAVGSDDVAQCFSRLGAYFSMLLGALLLNLVEDLDKVVDAVGFAHDTASL